MKRLAVLAMAAFAVVGCVKGPESNGGQGWTIVADPANGRTFHCYWWDTQGRGGGTIWCYEPEAGAR